MHKISSKLLSTNYNGYSEDSEAKKEALHAEGLKLLKHFAKDIGFNPSDYVTRSNKAGIAVSGEVTLHANTLYMQMYESAIVPGLQVLFRSCDGQKDYTGGPNNTISLRSLTNADTQARFITQCKKISGLYVDTDFSPT